MSIMNPRVLGLVLAPALVACAPPDDFGLDDGEDGIGATDGDVDPQRSTAPLEGVALVDVELNPGVAMPLWRDGSSVETDLPLPRGREAVIWVEVELPADAVGDELIARAILRPAGGDAIEAEQTRTATEARTAFEIAVPGEAVAPGLALSFDFRRVVDPDSAIPGASAELPPTPLSVPVSETTTRMRVVIIPVDYTGPDCEAKVDVMPELQARLVDAIYEVNAVSEVELSVGEPLPFDGDLGSIGGMSQLLAASLMRRSADDPAPEVYHYTLFDNCGQCLSYEEGGPCKVGTAAAIVQPTQLDGRFRVALGQLDPPDRTTEWTLVHELGHLQGRHHVYCPTQDAGTTDGQFPHEDGLIGTRGYGVRGSGWFDPETTHDYMSYCHETWVSDYTWRASYERAQLLTSWEAGDAIPQVPVSADLLPAAVVCSGA